MPVTTTSRNRKTKLAVAASNGSRKYITTPRSFPRPISDPDVLATQLAETLTITPRETKGKQKAATAEEQKLEAMRMINRASQHLSTIAQSGWKKSSDAGNKSKLESAALEASSAAARYLDFLRSLSNDDLNVERAGMSIVGKLVALELFDSALTALTRTHYRICDLVSGQTNSTHLLSIPCPSNTQSKISTVLATLVSTYLLNAFMILTHTHRQTLSIDLLNRPSLFEWIPILSSLGLSNKHLDSILTKIYSVLMKFSAKDVAPDGLFQIRMYGLQCLAHTSPGIVENPGSLWDQACKVASALISSSNGRSVSESARAATSAFLDLHTSCEARSDRDAFMSGKGFTSFCETWIGYASKAKNVRALEKIAQTMYQISTSSHCPTILVDADDCRTIQEDSDILRQGTRLCAAFAQLLSVLDNPTHDDQLVVAQIRDVRDIIEKKGATDPLITRLLMLPRQKEVRDKDLLRIAGKAGRALGRVRRASLDVFVQQSTSKEANEELLRLLEDVISLYETVIQGADTHCDPDYLTHMLDTLFILSRANLNVSDPRTYDTAYDLLAKGMNILSLSSDADHLSPPSPTVLCIPAQGRPDFIRCTSGAFYNLGGTLYQTGRYSSAIPFLKQGCRLGMAALDEHDKHKEGDADQVDVESDPWLQLKEQLWRRFQLLGVCFMKIGDRKHAFDSFVHSVCAFPYSTLINVDKVPFCEIAGLSPAVTHLRDVIENLTHLGACELMLSAKDVSLQSVELQRRAGPSVIAILMEWQVQSLESFRWQKGVRDIMVFLLQETLLIYREETMPVRSLRVFSKALELTFHVPLIGPKDGWLRADDIEEKAQILYNAKNLGKDEHLFSHRSEYYASIHLWLALHAHRHSNPDQVVLASRHTETACTTLRTMLTPTSNQRNIISKISKGSKKLSRVTTLDVGEVKGKAGLLPKGHSSKRPVTAKRKDEPQNLPPNFPQAQSLALPIDCIEALMNLLQLSAHVLGVLSLTLLKINILDVLRKLAETYSGDNSDHYISSSSELALEYLRLGKGNRAKKVLQQVLKLARSNQASDEARARFFLSFSASCAATDDVEQSIKFYQEGLRLAGRLKAPNKQASTTEKIQTHVARIEQTALAYEVFSSIQSTLNNASDSLDGLLKALRLWNRAFESLGRLQPPSPTPKSTGTEESDPFSTCDVLPTPTSGTPLYATSSQTEPPSTSRRIGNISQRRVLSLGLEWRVGQGLINAFFSLFQAYYDRGSPREAQYFAKQAEELAESVNAPAGLRRAMVKNVEVQLFQGLIEEGSGQLEKIEQCVNSTGDGDVHVDLAELHRLKGELGQRDSMMIDAQKHYEDAINLIESVDQNFSSLDGVEFGPRVSLGSSQFIDTLFPELLARVLCRYVWLLRGEQTETYMMLLKRFDSLPSMSTIQSRQRGLSARLALHDVYQRSRSDMFLSSIGETTIALSAGSKNLSTSVSPTSLDMAKNLEHAEQLFWSYLSGLGQRGYVPDIRESSMSIAVIKTFQASLGRFDPKTPSLTAGLLDGSSSLTLRSEMLEAITNKFPAISLHEELGWPKLSDSGAPLSYLQKPEVASDDSDSDSGNLDDTSLKKYWEAVRQRHQPYSMNAKTFTSSVVSKLPQNWTVAHISVTEDKNTMFISRQRGGCQAEPLVFCVPLKGRREDMADEHLTFEDALTEMNEIVSLSNETTKIAASIRHDPAARSKWWKKRGGLDTRLCELLENIEFCWLGAFKTILSVNPQLSPQAINNLRIQFDRVFQRGLRLQDRKTKERALGHKKMPSESCTPNRVTLDDALIECFSTLPPDCRDEELEDLVYFILDLYQFHGVPVAIAEIDIDQVVVDLRSVIQEHAEKSKSVGHGHSGAFGYNGRRDHRDEHLFLVLDKNVQGLPWENIPILRGRSVSRIPSISFLLDRIQFARLAQSDYPNPGGSSNPVDRAVCDPRNVYFIINPSGDLERTEERFKPWLKSMEKVGWHGISGRAPSELQVLNALRTKDLVVYFGHGGAEQYVRSHKIRSLPRCAAVMLWGCSSGALREMGDFDRVGTPLNYMLAGCPTLVANLWDVTDKDIDTFSQSVFDKLDMSLESIQNRSSRHTPVSVVQAVAESRNSCKLKYLTGAAPVVYGIPFYL
ncbi:cysteine peptidase C50 [Lentinula aciculospora]|uniref:separase n=1 Tax=Lentinula aciculospora TaxID=153920 RepID=A0A9W9ASK7_9AGAR|nr:cysteine peptidase C50 [Lentinula aciculospora]